jgi:serine/threonine protein kinase
LLEAAGRVKPRIILEGAESTFHRDLAAPFPGLLEAAGRVKPRIILEGAESTFHRDLTAPFPGLLEAAGRVKPRILLEGAESTFHRDLVPPAVIEPEPLPEILLPGSLTIVSQPPGGEVYLDDEFRGRTPLTLEKVAPGSYRLKIILEGYEEWERTVVVRAGMITSVMAELTALPPPTGSLSITSEPPRADVYINDDFRGRTPLTLEKVAPGSYRLKIILEGYEEWERTVVVRAGVITSVTAELTALPPPTGSLSITSRPSGARVYLEDDFRGHTPLTLERIAPGSYELNVTLEGYEEWERTVVVRAGVITSVTAELTTLPPPTGSLSITSRPSRADVYINDEFRGRTPLTLENLPPGSYRLKVILEGYEDWERSVVVRAGVITSVTAELTTLPPPTGSLSITSRPEGARVYLEDDFRGHTPLTLERIAPGSYELNVTLEGYEDWERSVVVRAGVITSVTAELTVLPPPTGSLSITSRPEGARVYLNDAYKGLTPLTLDLEPGAYGVALRKSGYQEWSTRITIKPGERTTLSPALASLPILPPDQEPPAPPTPLIPPGLLLPLIGTSIAAALALFAVMMWKRKPKPSPREVTPPEKKTPPYFPEELLPSYTPIRLLGKGGFARVFEVIRKKDELRVALKVPLDPKDPALKESFREEMGNWQRLKHGNIIELYEFATVPVPFLEMELGEESLKQIKKPLQPEETARLIFEAGRGLEYAHRQSRIHCDLKPSNILLKEGIPKISDWGLSRVKTERHNGSSRFGSPFYSAPEQYSPEKFGSVDERTDIFQLGIVLYELATGKHPFEGVEYSKIASAIQFKEPVAPSIPNPEASGLEPVILKCLRKEKEERYQTVRELRKALADFLRQEYGIKLKESRDSQDFRAAVGHGADLAFISAEVGDFPDLERRLKEVKEFAPHGFPKKQALSVLHTVEVISNLQGLCYEKERRGERVRYGEAKQQYKVLCGFLSATKFGEEVESDPDLGEIFKHFDRLYQEDDLLDYEHLEKLKFFCDKLIKKWQAFFLRQA